MLLLSRERSAVDRAPVRAVQRRQGLARPFTPYVRPSRGRPTEVGRARLGGEGVYLGHFGRASLARPRPEWSGYRTASQKDCANGASRAVGTDAPCLEILLCQVAPATH